MALADVLINKACPPDSYEQLAEVIAGSVGDVVYDEPDPHEASVTVKVSRYAWAKTFMEIGVSIDTEDLPQEGWVITEGGLAIPSHQVPSDELDPKSVPKEGLTAEQWDVHSGLQAATIRDIVATHPMWETGELGWDASMDASLKLGVLVTRVEGAWRATYPE